MAFRLARLATAQCTLRGSCAVPVLDIASVPMIADSHKVLAIICSAIFIWSGCTETDRPLPAGTLGDLNLHNRLAEQHLDAGRYRLALEVFQKALAGAEDSVRAYTGLSRTYLALEEVALAETALDQATVLDTSRAEIFYARAELSLMHYLKTHQGPALAQAIEAAQQAISRTPDRAVYHYGLGNLYNHGGQLAAAEMAYRQALSLDPRLASVYERLGSLYRYQGRLAAAEVAYEKYLELQPQDARVLCELAVLYRLGGREAAAIELLERAVRLDEELAAAHLNLGQLYLAAGQREAGEQALERFRALQGQDAADLLAAAEARPQDAQAQLALADVLAADGRDRTAERCYLEAIRLDSELGAAHTGLGRLYLRQGRLEEAENALLRARDLHEDSAEVLAAIGEVYLRQERYMLAVQALEKATALDSTQSRALELLAAAQRRSGQ